jgi:arylsulfatase A-like enzyme
MLGIVILAGLGSCAGTLGAAPPNILFILADDLGYGDVKCLNPEGKIATPNMDRLAAAGIVFTDAHSSSSVCTPTRYGILTGRYGWRSRLKSGVLEGFSRPLIEPGRLTVAGFLQRRGYATACLGKWHLGMDWPLKGEGRASEYSDAPKVDYAMPIRNGPNAAGFDYYYGISASLDMPPFTFIENDCVVAVPTVEKQWVRKGPAAPDFEAVDVLPALTRKAVEYVNGRAAEAKRSQPFFLYLALTSPHTPILPTAEWAGKSGLNSYGDFVMQTDQAVGAVLEALDKNGFAGNTLVILTSDNGCSPSANFPELLARGHNSSFRFRGHKADIFDGGHRIPFIARWPGRIKPGATSDQLICLNDLFATCADILAAELPNHAAEDSVSILPALEGRDKRPLREAVVHHSINGSFSIRQGNWKLEFCSDSGGWSDPKPGSKEAQALPPTQLYDLSQDIGERRNVAASHPEIVARLTRLLEKYVTDGRSTPGAPQPNTTPVKVRRPHPSTTRPAKDTE